MIIPGQVVPGVAETMPQPDSRCWNDLFWFVDLTWRWLKKTEFIYERHSLKFPNLSEIPLWTGKLLCGRKDRSLSGWQLHTQTLAAHGKAQWSEQMRIVNRSIKILGVPKTGAAQYLKCACLLYGAHSNLLCVSKVSRRFLHCLVYMLVFSCDGVRVPWLLRWIIACF